jgi:hypothetical protein
MATEGIVPTNQGFQIILKLADGKSEAVSVSEGTTVQEVKDIIFKKHQIPVDQQRLVFAGKEMQNTNTMKDYNVTDNNTLNLVFRLRGGC